MLLPLSLLCLMSTAWSQGPLPPIYRLPHYITPLSYLLHLKPDLDTNTVSGIVLIDFNTTSNQSVTLTTIMLSLGVNVVVNETRVLLMEYTGEIKQIGAVQYDDANTLLKLVLPDGDVLGHNQIYKLSLEFKTTLNSEPKGLFVGWYNSTSKYVASNFRPTHARDLFPCFDEPNYKVPVMLQILRPATYVAVSTAPLSSSKDPDSNNMVLDTFQATPPISIHSLGLLIYPAIPITTMGVNLYAPPGTPPTVQYLQYLLYNITSILGPFPVAPLSLVILPDRLYTTFSAYGFVFTSPEVYSGEVSSLKWPTLKIQLTEAFVRQFLEYLKTPHWWCDIWLSESLGAFFATTLQPEPLYKVWLRVDIRSNALGVDFSNTSGPVINHNLMSRGDIESVLTNQTIRNKGLSVLAMWDDTMPEGLVTKTLLDFIRQTPNNSIVYSEDFLDIMAKNIAANTTYDVTPAIPQLPFWLNTTGYGVVSYWPQSSSNFFLSQSPGCPNTQEWAVPVYPRWPISVSYAQNSSRDWDHYRRGLWLLNTTLNVSVSLPLDQWTILNLESAPYRVNYAYRWYQIVAALATDLTPPSGFRDSPFALDSIKSTIQDDAVALSLLGCLPFSTAFTVLSTTQRSLLDWLPVAKTFDVITAKIGNDSRTYSQLQVYATTLFSQELLTELDLKNRSSSVNLQFARAQLTPWLCQFNISNFRQAVVELNQQLLQGNTTVVDASDIETVACFGARYDVSSFDTLMAVYLNTTDLWLKYYYTIGLSCVTDPISVQSILQKIASTSKNNITNSGIAVGDAKKILVGLASSVQNSAALVDFIVNQAPKLQAMLGSTALSDIIKTLSKLRVNLTKLASLNDETLGLDPYVMQAAVLAMEKANSSEAWWITYAAKLQASLPAPPTTPTTLSTIGPTGGTTGQTGGTTGPTGGTTGPTGGTTGPTGGTTGGVTTGPGSTTPSPSSAKSLLEFRVVSLVVATVLITVSFSL